MADSQKGVPAGAGAAVPVTSLARLSAIDMLDGYRQGRFTPSDVIEDVIVALRSTDELCNVMVTPMFDTAREAAHRHTVAWRSGDPQPALAGVPVSVKDLIFVAGVPARGGAPELADFVPSVDAAVVTSIRAAGAVLTCKTTTCESGYKLTADSPLSGITRNPWRLDRTSGGSSGGAAAAVAAGCGPLALGTDGVGSIRVPSSFCGVVGIKPTFGLVPRAPGFAPPSWASLAHTGPIGRTVRDVALLLEVIAGHDPRDAASLPVTAATFDVTPGPLDGVRIAFTADLGFAAVAPAVRAAFEQAVLTLERLGATMVPDDLGLDPQVLETTIRPIAYTEQAAAVMSRSDASLLRSDPEYRQVIERGRLYRGIDYIDASYRRNALRSQFLGVFGRVDAIITPTVAVTAFAAGTLGVDSIDGKTVDRHLGWSPFSWPINLAGLPAATLPCGFDADALPIGLQIIAPWLNEALIIRIAAAFEAASAPLASMWPSLGRNTAETG